MEIKTDVVIVGTGVGGAFSALNLPEDKQIVMITKSDLESSDSFLAQGGICVLRDDEDYEGYFEDTMRAGHYENRKESVDIMIRSSQEIIHDLIEYGVDFAKKDGNLAFTREGAHSRPRILFHEDITGKEITSKLLTQVKKRKNIQIHEFTTMTDIIVKNGKCAGILAKTQDGEEMKIYAQDTIFASGGIGGIYRHSTNYRHLTGDGVAVAIRHGVKVEHVDYVQIHPTTFYSEREEDRSFLISESVRGEGALLYDKNYKRFTNELLPRDIVTENIKAQMKKDGTKHVWLSMRPIEKEQLEHHFPNIIGHCKEHGYNVPEEMIPVVPAQHYFMGGIKVNLQSKTSMNQLYAVGETACNGVHGKNRLASNSLLESMVFAKRAAGEMTAEFDSTEYRNTENMDLSPYSDLKKWNKENKEILLEAIDKGE